MALRPGDEYRDILDIIPERFDADADSRQARAGHRLRTISTLILAVLAVGGIVAAGWRFMGDKRPVSPGIPVIKADERPIKVRPEDRGGMQVPNQDKLVYERMDGEGQAKTERLLPPPEQPKAPPKPELVEPPPVIPAVPEAVKADPPPPPAVQPAPVPPAPPAYAPVETRPAVEKPAPAPVAEKPAKPAPVVTPVVHKPPASGDYLVQLSSVRSADAAEKEWARIQKTHGELVGSLKSDIVQVDLGEKGTFWRVRAGSLSETAARQLCQDLIKRNQGCIVARK